MLKDNLIHYRNKNNMTQEELANKSCVSRSSIALYEKGLRKPTSETVNLICNALNISVNDLIEDRSIKRSIINYFLCLLGFGLATFILIFLIWDSYLEIKLFEKIIFSSFTSNSKEILTYLFSLALGILMYYLLFLNLKKSIKRKIIFITTIPIFILFLIYSFYQQTNIFYFIPDSIIYYVFLPLLLLYYFFIFFFIFKNFILETRFLKERINNKYINLFLNIINTIYITLIIVSIVYVYTANVEYTIIESVYYEHNGTAIIKSHKTLSLLEAMHKKKLFSILFLIFQVLIASISLISITIKNNKRKSILTLINACLCIIFVFLWTIYPRIFGDIIDEIRFIPCGFDC